jgi:hypothetical protein
MGWVTGSSITAFKIAGRKWTFRMNISTRFCDIANRSAWSAPGHFLPKRLLSSFKLGAIRVAGFLRSGCTFSETGQFLGWDRRRFLISNCRFPGCHRRMVFGVMGNFFSVGFRNWLAFYILVRDNFCFRTHSVIWKKYMFYFVSTSFFQKMECCFFAILAVAGFH